MRRTTGSKASNPETSLSKGEGAFTKSAADSVHQNGVHPSNVVCCYSGTFCVYLLANLLPILPELPYPLSKSLVSSPSQAIDETNSIVTVQTVLAFMFTFHFVKRSMEATFVHIYVRKQPLSELIGVHVYYWVFAFWMGWATRTDFGFIPPPMPYFAGGIIFFWIGEIGNFAVHMQLKNLRKSKASKPSAPSGRVIPRGVLFSLVSCPHYTFEIVAWLGFALSSMVLASFGLLIASIIILMGMAMMHHKRYLSDFDGKEGRELYPQSRKALFPVIY